MQKPRYLEDFTDLGKNCKQLNRQGFETEFANTRPRDLSELVAQEAGEGQYFAARLVPKDGRSFLNIKGHVKVMAHLVDLYDSGVIEMRSWEQYEAGVPLHPSTVSLLSSRSSFDCFSGLKSVPYVDSLLTWMDDCYPNRPVLRH